MSRRKSLLLIGDSIADQYRPYLRRIIKDDFVFGQRYLRSTTARFLEVSVRNIGGIPAKNVGVKIYARHLKSNKRSLVKKVVIPQICNGDKDRALIQTTWRPVRSGPSRLEVDIEPSDQYTILSGLTEMAVLPVGEPISRSLRVTVQRRADGARKDFRPPLKFLTTTPDRDTLTFDAPGQPWEHVIGKCRFLAVNSGYMLGG